MAPCRDPRLYQITVLSGLVVYGWATLGFDITAGRAALLIATCLAAQFAWTRGRRLAAFDARSALISALSLCLLFRANEPLLAIAAAIIAIGSKFLVRIRGKHVFNPTNFGLVVMLLLSDAVWVSPGQWGNAACVRVPDRVGDSASSWSRARRAPTSRSRSSSSTPRCWLGRSLWLGRAAGDPIAPPPERRAAPVRVLHDLRSEDDAGLARRTPAVRRARRGRRGVRAVPPLPHQRLALVARVRLAARASHRSPSARLAIRVARLRGSAASARLAPPTRNRQPTTS